MKKIAQYFSYIGIDLTDINHPISKKINSIGEDPSSEGLSYFKLAHNISIHPNEK